MSLVSSSSIYPEHDRTAWILARRPARVPVSPWLPHGFFLEKERSACGEVVDSAGILLTNKECPWHCLMCDLWKHTLTNSVPPGAIPKQIEYALAQLGGKPKQTKLYNSGSFFDPAAIPPEDYEAIAGKVAFAEHVIVEAHPRLIGERVLRFRDHLKGSLEVAMGLETVHPEVLPRLNKRFSLEQFASAAALLRNEGIGVRAFVLVKPPFLNEDEAIEWGVKSARFAFDCCAGVVSLIPTRPGNGALDDLILSGEFTPPNIVTLERCLEAGLQLRAGRVFADTWDLQQFSSCATCFKDREQRLQLMNLSQAVAAPVRCRVCAESNLAA